MSECTQSIDEQAPKAQTRLQNYIAFLATSHKIAKTLAAICMLGLAAGIASTIGVILTEGHTEMGRLAFRAFNAVVPTVPYTMGGFLVGTACEWTSEFLLKRNLKKLKP